MRIGIDLGGTKIEGIALDDNGTELFRKRVATPQYDYDATVQQVVDLILDIELQTKSSGSVGLGIPGAISPATSFVKNANSTWLIGRELQVDLSEKLNREIRITNDANCFAMSEATDGAAAGAHCVFGVIIGTGTGGGIVINGNILIGVNAIGGEWGHNPMPWPDDNERHIADCYCGKQDCIETYLSGTGFERDHKLITGQDLSSPEIINAATQGNKSALASLERYERRMAKALASVINIVDPDVIVLGGGMSNVARLYTNVPKIWQEYVFSDQVDTKLVAPKYGDSSGVRGAAWLWPKKLKV
ncbi:MAG: ROK family protein [Gammaproteobacteria bacterium]